MSEESSVVPNVIAPPPLVFLGTLALGQIIHLIRPAPPLPRFLAPRAGYERHLDTRPMTRKHKPFDFESYVQDIQTKPCFLCEIVAGNPEYAHHLVYEDEIAIAFLNKCPVLYGYTLVAPKEHREQVTGDFSAEEYLELQRVIYRVAEAVRLATEAERV